MNELVGIIRRKRIIFTLVTVGLAVLYGLINWLGEGKISETELKYIILAWRLSMATLSMWFGYAVGIKKQTIWFVSMLAILPPPISWLGVLYLLYKSGQMQLEAKRAETSETALTKRDASQEESNRDKPRKTKKKAKK